MGTVNEIFETSRRTLVDVEQRLEMPRREFLQFCATLAVTMGLPAGAEAAVAKAIEDGYGPDYGQYVREHGPDDEQAQQQVWDTIRDLRVYTDRPWQPITRAVLVELARLFPG
jgi:hypothetical protein